METWLPSPPPPPQKPRSGRRTLILWVVLLVFFIALYNLFQPSGPTRPDRLAEPATIGFGWWAMIAAGLVGAALPAALLWWQFSRGRSFNALQAPALEQLGDGNYARAADMFGEVARSFRGRLNYHAVAAFNQGYALVRAGDSAAAAGVLIGVERTPSLGTSGVRELAAFELARAFAIGGDVDKAAVWIAASRDRMGVVDQQMNRARFHAVEVLVLCRQAKLTEALALCEREWARLETYLPIRQMRELCLLRAFALASTSSPREAGAADAWLRWHQGMPAGSLAWMYPHWPELAAFAASKGLA